MLAGLLLGGTAAFAHGIEPRVCLAKLSAGETAAAVARQPSRFVCNGNQISQGPGDFVARLEFPRLVSSIDAPLVLRLPSLWQDETRVHFTYADGSQAVAYYSSKTAAQNLTIGAVFEIPIPVRAAALTSVFVELRGATNLRGVILGPHVLSAQQSYMSKLLLVTIYAAFGGLALALLVYNISLWFALRSRFLLDYCLMVVALALYTVFSSGLATILDIGLENNDRLRINYVLLALTGITAVRFIRNFFGRDIYSDRLIVATKAVGWTTLIAAIAVASLSPWEMRLLDKAYFVMMSAMLASGAPLIVLAVVRKAPYAKLFVFAWSAPIIISALRAAYGFGLVPYSILLDNSSLIALSIEALLSSVIVTARLRQITSERDVALLGEQAARTLAATDPLTGLLNRRAFLDQAIGRRTQQRLLLIDIDHFKSVNDRLGHQLGDTVLSTIASALDTVRPPRSLAVRLGGEEFALLVPRSSADKCTPEAILQAVRSSAMPQGVRVTVSIGFSEGMIGSEEDWKRLYRLADAALYRAKADGRDRACRATDFRDAA
ncbi:MAG: diguanylate cyclase domain-containing protein [Novosphingobium sp.]